MGRLRGLPLVGTRGGVEHLRPVLTYERNGQHETPDSSAVR